MQAYLRKPEGMKPMFSRQMVDLSLELHIPPQSLYQMMFCLRQREVPHIGRLWQKYGDGSKRLARDVKTLRRMRGFSSSGEFYEGVATNESFEKDFRPVSCRPSLKPVMLIVTLDLYFRLTPATMVAETPEVAELARMMKVKAADVVEIMEEFQLHDPCLRRRKPAAGGELAEPCREVWQRFGNGEIETLAALAAQMKEYFR